MNKYDKEVGGLDKINMLLEKAVSLIPKEESLTEVSTELELQNNEREDNTTQA